MRQSQTPSNDDSLSENRVELEGKKEGCSTACGEPERREGVHDLITKITSRMNLNLAYKRVRANKGSAGSDGMTVEELFPYLIRNRDELIKQMRMAHTSHSP